MGHLEEVSICKIDSTTCYKGHAWTCEDGSLEAFWFEGGKRLTQSFDVKGTQLGVWRKYLLRHF